MGSGQSKEIKDMEEYGRRPNDNEMIILYMLKVKSTTIVTPEMTSINYLRRYWYSMLHTLDSFALETSIWKRLGFTSAKPIQELKRTGLLGLECLVFFAENYSGEMCMMNRYRYGYPLSYVAQVILRSLLDIFYVLDLPNGNENGKYPITSTLYWQILQEPKDFYQLFALCFLLFDELYCDYLKTKQNLPKERTNLSLEEEEKREINVNVVTCNLIKSLVDQGKQKLWKLLCKAPKNLQDLQCVCKNGVLRSDDELVISFQPLSSPYKRMDSNFTFHKETKLKRKLSIEERLQNTVWNEKNDDRRDATIISNGNPEPAIVEPMVPANDLFKGLIVNK